MTNFYGIQKLHLKLFVDAVFGIAITLLAVELQIPQLITSYDNDLSDEIWHFIGQIVIVIDITQIGDSISNLISGKYNEK